MYDIEKIRSDFPALSTAKCFLDSGASAQKPQCVIDKVNYYSNTVYANVHRGTYAMSEEITQEYENSRKIVADFVNAEPCNIVYTKNATEAINLVAYSYGQCIEEGSEIIISAMEHHANIVPWSLLCSCRNIILKVCPVLDNGDFGY